MTLAIKKFMAVVIDPLLLPPSQLKCKVSSFDAPLIPGLSSCSLF